MTDVKLNDLVVEKKMTNEEAYALALEDVKKRRFEESDGVYANMNNEERMRYLIKRGLVPHGEPKLLALYRNIKQEMIAKGEI